MGPIANNAALRRAAPRSMNQSPNAALFQVRNSADDRMLRLILLIILILAVLGSVPLWPYSAGWGYYPSGGLGLVVLIVVILLVMGRI